MTTLSEFISIRRRYSRAVNLERDIGIPDSLIGYIPTSRAIDCIERFLRSFRYDNSVRAWTLTGSYGTGKSAFANFLTAICAPRNYESYRYATEILKQTKKSDSVKKSVETLLPKSGLIRAVATAQREPIAVTILRALHAGANIYWKNTRGRRPEALAQLESLYQNVQEGITIDNNKLLQVLVSLAEASKAGILLIIDELGKNLEYSAQQQSMNDLYLLQQIAELPSNRKGCNIYLFGLLHQSFIDYAHGMASVQRNEWAKIQGRFEDIPFVESPGWMIRLITQAIDQSTKRSFKLPVEQWAKKWESTLSQEHLLNHLSGINIDSIYPLHPLSALILPILCVKYSQNDRTLFTFLASGEPESFSTFVSQERFENERPPSFKLHKVYDYFVESPGISISARPQFQRWIEIQTRLHDAGNIDEDSLNVLKTIGLLNLISTTGALKASKKTVKLAMCRLPDDKADLTYWDEKIEELKKSGFIIWRKSIDELRIWEGSDFDIEQEIAEQVEALNLSLADLLNEYSPLKPLIAHRHSYQTGTLRYFERLYLDKIELIDSLECHHKDSDGLICYWLGNERDIKNCEKIPEKTSCGKPVLIACGGALDALSASCHEYVALRNVEKNAKQLQTDGVARKEVRQRVFYAQKNLNVSLSRSFDIGAGAVSFYVSGKNIRFKSWRHFQSYLSLLCDSTYDHGPCLWNELINRRELTSQGASARNKLLRLMLENNGKPKLGISGHGPEFSMFESVLVQTGLYVESKNGWIFSRPPQNKGGVYSTWKAIDDFCKTAIKEPKCLKLLYDQLQLPPYGVKQGVIPVLLLAVLIYNNEYVSVYLDGTFIPILGPEHMELLVKKPERFSVKFFEVSGLRAEVFHEIGNILSSYNYNSSEVNFRNKTILSIVKPLIGFVRNLPQFTLKTEKRVTNEAKAVRRALLEAKEPDELIFSALPQALGLPPITGEKGENNLFVTQFRKQLIEAFSSLQSAYDDLLGYCEDLIKRSFAIRLENSEFRENLKHRAINLKSQVIEPRMRNFILSLSDKDSGDREWLEKLLLIVANKSPKSWTDEDVLVFETKLSDIARRFMNLEALQKEIAIPKEGIDARRITLTYPEGGEIHKVLWIDRDQETNIELIAEQIINNNGLKDDTNLKQAVIATLIEKAFFQKHEDEKELKKQGVEKGEKDA